MSHENVERVARGWRTAVGSVRHSSEEGVRMKRSLLASATLALALGLSAPASAAITDGHASCAGIAGASRAGQPGVQAEVVLRVVTEARTSDPPFSPGALEFSGFARDNGSVRDNGSLEECLA
jgi:hypothetical protein